MKAELDLFPIEEEHHDNFVCATGLSDFIVNALMELADEIFHGSYEPIFCDNQVWVDTQRHRYSVFMTKNGIAMLKNWDLNMLYRVEFKY